MYPVDCLSGKIYPGESCSLRCLPGFKPINDELAQCLPGRIWSTTNLNCMKNIPKAKALGGGEVLQHSHIDQSQLINSRNQMMFKPYIKCPQDTMIVLPKNEKTVFIKLEQPKSNVDFAK